MPTIAIVDDDESLCSFMSRLLRSLGMDTDTFTSGDEFIERLETVRAFHPDCVVLDVQMPGMNGLEVQELLVRSQTLFRSSSSLPTTRCVYVSGRCGQVRWPSCVSRSMKRCSSKHLMKLSKGTARGQAKDSGRVPGGAGWYGGCASAQDKPPAAPAVPALSMKRILVLPINTSVVFGTAVSVSLPGHDKPGNLYEGCYGGISPNCFSPVLIDRTAFGRA